MAKVKIETKIITGKMTDIMFCGCESEFQDNEYGKGKRVHNKTLKSWRCTVCGNEKK